MNNYKDTKHKIRNIWETTINNKNNAGRLESGLIKVISLNYNKIINDYIVYNGVISNSDPIIYKVELKQFPESILPNLKTILTSTSASSKINYYTEDKESLKTIYIFYEGAATITITLNVVTPQDAK
jgi:hypothetical protein